RPPPPPPFPYTTLFRSLLPGAAIVELAMRAGDQLGCGLIEELVLSAPLVLPPTGVQIQLAVHAADASGRRRVALHSLEGATDWRSEEHTSVLQSRSDLV